MVIFDCASLSFRGLRTHPVLGAIPSGYFADAKNIRVDTKAIALRAGQTQLKDNSSLSGTCIGATLVTYGSTTYYIFAVTISGAVRIYYNAYTGSWGAATEITASSGFFGNSRMTAPSSGFVTFTKVYSRTDGLCVVVQDGSSDPRVIKMSAIASGNMRVIKDVPAPQEIGGISPVFGTTDCLNIQTTSTPTIANGSGTFATTATGSGPYYLSFTTGAGAMVVDDYSQITGLGTMDLADARQVFFFMEVSSDTIFRMCKWELICANYNVTIHDPEAGLDSLVSVETNKPGLRVYAFPLGEYGPSERVPGGGGPGTCSGIKITCQNTSVAVNATASIYGVATGGRVPGFAEYSQTWYCSGSMTESPEVVLKNTARGASAQSIFFGDATALPENFYLPLSESLYYAVKVTYLAGDQDLVDEGVDYVNIYRRDPGETERTYVTQKQVATYSSSWGYFGSFDEDNQKGTHLDTAAPEDKVYERIAPDAFNEQVPIGQAATWANSRHYVGSFKSSSSEPKSCIKVSEQDEPFRFASISRETAESAYSAQLDGEEVIVAFQPVSSSIIGSSTVYCFTNKAMYSVDGFLIRRISSVGAIAGVAENLNRMFWLDQNRSIRRSEGGIDDISRLRIDSNLTAATNVSAITAAFHRDRYYFGYSGGVLIWSELLGDWESLDTPGVTPTVFMPWRVGGEAKLYFAGSDGSLYEYESGSTDNGSNITFSLKTPDIHKEDWERVTVGGAKIVCSDKNSSSMSVTYTALSPAATQTGTINLDAGGSESTTWRRDRDATTEGKTGISGTAVNVALSASITYPFTLYSLVLETNGRAGYGRD